MNKLIKQVPICLRDLTERYCRSNGLCFLYSLVVHAGMRNESLIFWTFPDALGFYDHLIWGPFSFRNFLGIGS